MSANKTNGDLILLTVTHIPTNKRYHYQVAFKIDNFAGVQYKSFYSYFNTSKILTFKENEIVTNIQY